MKNTSQVTENLSHLLANTYAIALKTQNFHWNVTGPQFYSLHKLFEEQYDELIEATDEIAERIRALGKFAPASFSQFAKLSTIKDENSVPAATDMLKKLVKDHETIIEFIRDAIPHAEKAEDEATVDLLVTRIEVHEKTAWMLRSSI